jgi:hypothetical protein
MEPPPTTTGSQIPDFKHQTEISSGQNGKRCFGIERLLDGLGSHQRHWSLSTSVTENSGNPFLDLAQEAMKPLLGIPEDL